MRGVTSSLEVITQIQELRKVGNSISEISLKVKKSKSIVSKYIQGVKVLPEYKEALLQKQGGTKERSKQQWLQSQTKAQNIIGKLSQRDRILILACLYWGEGTKRELNIINGDPFLLRTFVACVTEIGVKLEDIKVSLRLFEDIPKEKAIKYWSDSLGLQKNQILSINTLNGKKKGKLQYGMCRLRVKKGAPYFKLLISIINQLKETYKLS